MKIITYSVYNYLCVYNDCDLLVKKVNKYEWMEKKYYTDSIKFILRYNFEQFFYNFFKSTMLQIK